MLKRRNTNKGKVHAPGGVALPALTRADIGTIILKKIKTNCPGPLKAATYQWSLVPTRWKDWTG